MEIAISQNRARDWGAVIFALLLPTAVTLAYFVMADGAPPIVQQIVYGIAKPVQFLFPIVWVLFVERRSVRVWPWSARGTLIGLLFGIAVSTAMSAIYYFGLKSMAFFVVAADEIRSKIAGMNLGSPTAFVALGVFYSLIHSLLEEYFWRWFVFGQLKNLTRLWPAIVISSLGFMAHHVLVLGTFFGFASPWTWLFSLCIAVGGAVWAWIYNRSGSLVGPWISHLFVDAAIFYVGFDIARPLFEK